MSESWLLNRWTSIIDGFNLSTTSKSVGFLYVCVRPDDTGSVDTFPTSPPLRSSGPHWDSQESGFNTDLVSTDGPKEVSSLPLWYCPGLLCPMSSAESAGVHR